MNYPESSLILEKIKNSSNILVNCHASPDADSVGSALAFYELLTQMNKNVSIVCPHNLPGNLEFLANSDKVKTIDYSNFDYSSFDLFITLDSAGWNRVTGRRDIPIFDIPIIVIDHHETNEMYGDINLVKFNIAANCELVYFIINDMKIEINNSIAQDLLTGIIGDTGALRFPEANEITFDVVAELMKFADKNKIIRSLYQSYSLDHVKLWGKIMEKIQIDQDKKIVWSALNYEEYQKLGHIDGAKSELADILIQSIENTDFGFIAIEESPNFISVSFRSRTGVDVSKIAIELGGGGHKWASAARLYDMNFSQGIDKILNVCRNLK